MKKIKCVLRLVIPGVGQGAHSVLPELFLERGGKQVSRDSKPAAQKLRRRTLWALEAGEGPESGHSHERWQEEAYRRPPAWFSLLSAFSNSFSGGGRATPRGRRQSPALPEEARSAKSRPFPSLSQAWSNFDGASRDAPGQWDGTGPQGQEVSSWRFSKLAGRRRPPSSTVKGAFGLPGRRSAPPWKGGTVKGPVQGALPFSRAGRQVSQKRRQRRRASLGCSFPRSPLS